MQFHIYIPQIENTEFSNNHHFLQCPCIGLIFPYLSPLNLVFISARYIHIWINDYMESNIHGQRL